MARQSSIQNNAELDTLARRSFLKVIGTVGAVPAAFGLTSIAHAQNTPAGASATVVDSISTLRALTVSSFSSGAGVFVQGYYSSLGDGGGWFVYSSSSTAVGDGGTVIVPLSGPGRWLRIINGGVFTPEMFGAKGDSVSDDLLALRSAIQVAQSQKGILRFAPRTYLISDYLEITSGRWAMEGAGVNATYLASSSTTADIIRVIGTQQARVANFSIRGFGLKRTLPQDAVPLAGIGISLIYTAVAMVDDMQIDGCPVGVYMKQATNSHLNRIYASITSGSAPFTGFWLNGGYTQSSVSSILTSCAAIKTSGHNGNSFGFVCDGMEVQDLKFVNPETAGCAFGIYLNGSSIRAGLYLADIEILNPVLDQVTATGILIASSGAEGAITITDGWINSAPNADCYGFYSDKATGVVIKGTQFYADTNFAKARGVGLNNSERVTISNCTFVSQRYGVVTSGSNKGCIVAGSTFSNQNTAKAAATHITLGGCSRCIVSGNTLAGFATTGISLPDASAVKNIISNNTVDPTNIGSPLVNNGSLTVMANNILT